MPALPKIPLRLLINLIGDALPAPSLAAITIRVNAATSPAQYRRATKTDVAWTVSNIRTMATNCDLAWTITHTKRTKTTAQDRFHKLLVNPEDDSFVPDDGRLNELILGVIAVLRHTSQMQANNATAIQTAISYVRSTTLRRELRSWVSDEEWMARRATELAQAIYDERVA